MSNPLPRRAQISPQALYGRLDEEGVILNLSDENYYGLGDVGARVWELLATTENPEEIVSALLAEYDVQEEILRADLAHLLSEMERAGLISVEM
ncbi:MAG TPA: PqqD family protein [Anaerolineae bacterium]|nr:PqqD family protein [Anaerolineae bacterium]